MARPKKTRVEQHEDKPSSQSPVTYALALKYVNPGYSAILYAIQDGIAIEIKVEAPDVLGNAMFNGLRQLRNLSTEGGR